MSSPATAQLALAFCGIAVTILGLYLAAVALMFQSLVAQAEKLSVEVMRILGETAAWVDALSEPSRLNIAADKVALDEYLGLLRFLGDADFQSREFEANKFMSDLFDKYAPLSKSLARLRNDATETAKPVGLEINTFIASLGATLGQFGRSVRAYERQMSVWRPFRSDLRRAWLGGAYVAVAAFVGVAAATTAPSIGQRDALNLLTVVGLALGLAAMLSRMVWVVQQVAKRY